MTNSITITVNKEVNGKEYQNSYQVDRDEWRDAKLHHGIEWFIAWMVEELDKEIDREATNERN